MSPTGQASCCLDVLYSLQEAPSPTLGPDEVPWGTTKSSLSPDRLHGWTPVVGKRKPGPHLTVLAARSQPAHEWFPRTQDALWDLAPGLLL